MRAATRGAGAGAVLAGSTVAVAVISAGLVFSSSLGALTDEPVRYGWPYDAAAMIGFGYGGALVAEIGSTLDRPEVVDWGVANLGSVTIEGQTVASIAALEGFATMRLPVVDGRLPESDHEIALGTRTAADLDLGVGDRLTIASYFGERDAVVTGTVVLPSVGPFESERAAPGAGALLAERFFGALVADAERAGGLQPGSFAATGPGSFVVVDLADGVDSAEFLASADAEIQSSWDRNGFGVLTYAEPVRPAAIADIAGMRRLPLAFGAFVAGAMAGGYAISIAVATRARRRQLAILRALGCSHRQLAGSVRYHALTVAGIALVIGAPLGIVAGRVVYRTFARGLGVVVRVEIPLVWMAVVAGATIALGVLASAGPARSIVRMRSARLLRTE